MRTVLAVVFSLVCAAAHADEITRPCGAATNPTFEFRYHYRPGTPLVVYFPGGPGFGAMERSGWPIPKEFGVVLLDPRGVGANAAVCDGSPRLSTVDLAEDAVAVITKLKPNRLILYGASYGTAVATVAAHLLEQRKFSGETTLILEGVFGRALRPGEFAPPFTSRWSALYAALPQSSRDALALPSPLGFGPHVWGGWLEERLGMGEAPNIPQVATLLADLNSKELLAELTEFKNRPAFSPTVRNVFKAIGCHELVPSAAPTDNNFLLDRGRLIESPGDLCSDTALDRPFDAHNWPLTRTSIFYFIGTEDPVTFEALSSFHVAANPLAKKQILTVARAGHAPLQLSLAHCAEALIKTIAETRTLDQPSMERLCHRAKD